ncbi:MAG: M48 family metallopeptidase [Candidatus Thiodiazotropha sp. (ex Gloverina cf. vestifex)]|nr:M48 family metallopeptidase [Candidatus Thiodiazotropha sp. (ex Gloverina cf. vestifex)]
MPLFTQLFLTLLVLGTLLQLWLLNRHLTHVADHRDAVPQAFTGKVELDAHQKAADYTRGKGRLARIEIILGFLLLLLWTLGGGIEYLDSYWRTYAWNGLTTGLLLFFSFFFINSLLELPMSLVQTFRIESAFGFNRTTPQQYAKDRLLGAVLGIALGGPLLWVILWLMERAGDTWWLAAWAVWMAFTLTLTWAYPRLIAPLFNRFSPLDEGEMRQRIQALLNRCGFKSEGIFVMDGSKRSSHGNAYFTGFGKNKRIVFFDTLLKTLSVDEMEAVLAHELGHFSHRHILKQMALMSVLSLGGLALLGWLSKQDWFYNGLGVSHPSDATALLLFMLTLPVFTLFLSPLGSFLSRRYEFQADDYAVTQAGGGFLTQALVKLYRDNASTLTPDPLYSLFHDSHPPASVRIAHITQQAEAKGAPV